MKASTKKFVAKLLVLCMIIGLVPVVELALNTDIATLSSSAASDYYVDGQDVEVEEVVTSEGEVAAAVSVTGTADSAGTLTATIPADKMAEAVAEVKDAANAAEGKAPVVEVKINAKNAKSVALNLPKAPVADLGGLDNAVLRVASAAGTLEFDKDVIAFWGEKAIERQGITLSFEQKPVGRLNAAQRDVALGHTVYDFSVKSGTTDLGQFGGKAKIDLPYALPEGVKAEDVAVFFLADDGALTKCTTTYDAETATVSFETDHFSVYVIGDVTMNGEEPTPDLPFTDLNTEAWYMDAVKYCYDNKLMDGMDATTFAPENPVTRAMFAVLVYRQAGSPEVTAECPFTDVVAGSWYEKAVTWAAANEIVNGRDATTFDPDSPIQRQEMVKMLYNYVKTTDSSVEATGDLSAFTDASSVASYATEAMTWAVGAGVVKGVDDTTLAPQATTKRCEVAQLFMNYFGK